MLNRLLLLSLLLLLTHAAVADDAAPTPEQALQSFQGDWKVVRLEKGGEAMSDQEATDHKVHIEGDLLTLENIGEAETNVARVTLDPAKYPAWVDMVEVPDQADVVEGELHKLTGIYQLSKDTLTLCVSETPGRPAKFETSNDDEATLMILKRIPAGDDAVAPATQVTE